MSRPLPDPGPTGSVAEVFRAFLVLGLTSFGGPVAHLGYFRAEFVQRRQWLSDADYGDLVALGQFLPGPASSQVGLALGLMRAGGWGALAAWTAFTLPSALIMLAFAYGAGQIGGALGDGLILGLKIVAVAIVAQAVLGMARSFCPDPTRAGIAVAAVALTAMPGGALGQIAAILGGALAGLLLCRGSAAPAAAAGLPRFPVSAGVARACLAGFALLLAGLPLLAGALPALAPLDAFYRAGALVFGGGHVILPMLQTTVVAPGWIDAEAFLAGYGAAQALPGPLFTFAAYLGALADAPGAGGPAGALLALAAVFLPGMLLLLGVLPFWDALRRRHGMQAALRGTNAAVVGILGAALHDPVFVTAVTDGATLALALGCLVALTVWRLPPLAVVALGAAGGVLLGLLPG